MVWFSNIWFAEKYIYADAEDCVYYIKAKIKVSRFTNWYEISPTLPQDRTDIIRAIWSLVVELEEKGKLPKEKAIAWG